MQRIGAWFFGEVTRARSVGPEEFEGIVSSAGNDLPRLRSALAWTNAALRSPIIRPIVERIATDVSEGEYYLTDLKDGKRVRLEDSAGPADSFLDDPWPGGAGGTFQQLLKLFVAWNKVTGNVVALKDFSARGRLVGLIPVPTPYISCVHRLHVVGTNRVEVWLEVQIPDAKRWVKLPARDFFWHRDVSWNDPNGPGRAIVECLNDEVNQDEEASKFVSAFFANGCTPHMLVSVKEKGVTQPELDKLKAKWKKEYQGAVNAFRAMFVASDLSVVPVQSNTGDAQVPQVRDKCRDMALVAFSMPPEIMGIKHQSGKTSTEQADRFYRQQCIRPEMSAMVRSFNRQIFKPHFGSVRLAFVDPVREAAADQLSKTIQSWTNGLLSRESACKMLGLPAPPPSLAGQWMVPGNMFLVDDKGRVVMQTTTPSGTTAAPTPGGSTPATTPPKLGNGTINKEGNRALERYWNAASLS